MNAVQRSIDFTCLSFAFKETFRLHKVRGSSTLRFASSVSRWHRRIHINSVPEEVEPLTSLSSGNGFIETETQLLLHDMQRAVNLLPEKFRASILGHEERLELIELVLDYGRKPLARFPSGDFKLSEELVTDKDLEDAVASVGGFDDSNRAGLEGTLHRISRIRDRDFRIYGLTIRIGRAVTTETAGLVEKPLSEGQSILLIGPPGVGKTSAIRNFCKMLSETCKKRVMIVDTSSEIAGPGRIPHRAVGESRRMQVKRRSDQHNVMIEAVQNHMPEVIVIDEIGRREECHAARAISQRGVQLLATTHGRQLEDMVKDRVLRELVGGVGDVILGDERASDTKTKKKIVQERVDASSFDVVVEMADRTRWRIHYNANKAVDAILSGRSPEAEIRYLDEDDNMVVEIEEASIPEKNNRSSPNLQDSTCKNSVTGSESQSNIDSTNASMTGTTSEAQSSPYVNLHSEAKEKKDLDSARLIAEAEASRIMNASSDLDILQVESGTSYEELKECYKAIDDRIAWLAKEDNTVKQARARVHQAYAYLLFYYRNEADIDISTETNKEALRILKASSDLEVLQATGDASKKELRKCYNIVFKRVKKTDNEEEAMRIARHRICLAYTKLLRYLPS